jgi:hypothetical protein
MRALAYLTFLASLFLAGCDSKPPAAGDSVSVRLGHGSRVNGQELAKGCRELISSGIDAHRVVIEDQQSGLSVPFSSCQGAGDESSLAALWFDPGFQGQVILIESAGTRTLFSGSYSRTVWIVAGDDSLASDLVDFAHLHRDSQYYIVDVDYLKSMLPKIQVAILRP